MRIMVKVSVPTETGNEAITNGRLPEVVGQFLETWKPESAYFGAENGLRTMFAVVDMTDGSQIPIMFEPFYQHLNARIEFSPVMNIEEMKIGIEKTFARF